MQAEELASVSASTSTSDNVFNSRLAYGLDTFILITIFLFFLLNVPHAFLYVANQRSQVFRGYLLRSTTQLRMPPSPSGMEPESTEKEKKTLVFSVPTLESEMVSAKPWHFPTYFSGRHTAASHVIRVFLMAGYAAAIFFAAFYASNPFSNPKRIGWIITSQIPFVYAFATKNNLIGLLVGVGYEKLNYLHRHVGRLIVIGANVHAIGYMYKWTLAGNISKRIAEQYIRWGIVSLLCFDLLGFLSLQSVRKRYYNLFFGTHVVASIMVLFAACNHQPACIPFVIAGSAVYGVDHIIRAIKTRYTVATLRTIPELGLTQIDIPSLNTGWRAGQHVRLRVLSTALGLWTMTEVHPFTIASATDTEEGLILMCKKTGKWTRKLYEIAQTPVTGEQVQRRVKVMVEGPYGGIGDTTVPNYSGTMIVVGGSGVTFALSAVQDLVLAGDKSRAQVIDVIWCISDPAALRHFIPLFAVLTSQSGSAKLRVVVFYTRATPHSPERFLLPADITLTPGRPRIENLLQEFVISMISKGGTNGAFVGVCGPVSLARDVARAVRTLDIDSKKAVGGIHLHEEVFGW